MTKMPPKHVHLQLVRDTMIGVCLEGVQNYLPVSPFRRDSLDLPVRTVQSQTFMERIVIKVYFLSIIHSYMAVFPLLAGSFLVFPKKTIL